MKKLFIFLFLIINYQLFTVNCYSQQTGKNPIRVLYVGDAGVLLGPNIIASPFYYEQKGYEVHIWCQPLLDQLKKEPDIIVTHMTNWDALKSFPEKPEDIAAKYDVVILSDIEQECLVLYPWERMQDTPMGPNRVESIREFVRNGGGLMMVGGWESFTGRYGRGNWGNTAVEEALPIKCMQVNDDRNETPQGVHIQIVEADNPIVKGMHWETCPIFSGYNRLQVKPDATLIAKVKETGDPFIVAHKFGKGRSIAFASDISPHWGSGYQKWENYGKSFAQMLRWLAGKN